jgi:hypothetical protein
MIGNCGSIVYEMSVTVPVGATGTVLVPTLSIGAAAATIVESGSGQAIPVWTKGAYAPGAPGVTGATAVTDASGASVVQVGAGTLLCRGVGGVTLPCFVASCLRRALWVR